MKCEKCGTHVFQNIKECPYCGHFLRGKLKFWHVILAIIFLPTIINSFSTIPKDSTDLKKASNIQAKSSTHRVENSNAIGNVKLINDFENYYDPNGYSKDALKMLHSLSGISNGTEIFVPTDKYVVELYVKFKNQNPFYIQDIKYTCIQYAESGTAISKKDGVKYIGIRPNDYVYRTLNLGFRDDDVLRIKCKCTGFSTE